MPGSGAEKLLVHLAGFFLLVGIFAVDTSDDSDTEQEAGQKRDAYRMRFVMVAFLIEPSHVCLLDITQNIGSTDLIDGCAVIAGNRVNDSRSEIIHGVAANGGHVQNALGEGDDFTLSSVSDVFDDIFLLDLGSIDTSFLAIISPGGKEVCLPNVCRPGNCLVDRRAVGTSAAVDGDDIGQVCHGVLRGFLLPRGTTGDDFAQCVRVALHQGRSAAVAERIIGDKCVVEGGTRAVCFQDIANEPHRHVAGAFRRGGSQKRRIVLFAVCFFHLGNFLDDLVLEFLRFRRLVPLFIQSEGSGQDLPVVDKQPECKTLRGVIVHQLRRVENALRTDDMFGTDFGVCLAPFVHRITDHIAETAKLFFLLFRRDILEPHDIFERVLLSHDAVQFVFVHAKPILFANLLFARRAISNVTESSTIGMVDEISEASCSAISSKSS